MSRGPGKWQRMILDRTSQGQIVTIPDLLDPDFSDCQSISDMIKKDWSMRVAIERAIKTLARRGLIRLGRVHYRDGFQRAYQHQWAALPISVEYPFQHLDTVGNECFIWPYNSDADCRRLESGIIYHAMIPATLNQVVIDD